MYVKICGITKLDQAVAIAQLGADCLGYICVDTSPRFINCDRVKVITDALKDYKIDQAGIFLDADVDQISQYIHIANLNTVQLHGNESLEFCQQLRLKFPQIKLIKAFRVKNTEILNQVITYTNYVDVVLLDAYDSDFAGGTGKTIDWDILQNFNPNCDWWLAGGLSCKNVEMAIAKLNPDGIDVSSGVEKSPGDKDLELVGELLKLAKLASI
jgi:phosphoribosylanthranilate isomerase